MDKNAAPRIKGARNRPPIVNPTVVIKIASILAAQAATKSVAKA